MIKPRTNQQIIDDILLRCSEKLDKSMYNFESILEERSTIGAVEESLYLYTAGSILQLKADGEDCSNSPKLEREQNKELYEEERKTILRYLNTIIHFEISANRQDALQNCIKLLSETTRTFNQDFLNVLYLIVLFDEDVLYANLCKPLAVFCATIIDNEFLKQKEATPNEK